MELLFLYALTFLAGSTVSLQAGINSQLQATWAQHSILAACVSFAVGTLALAVCVLVLRIPVPPLAGKFVAWQWTGGFTGAFLVATTAFVAPKLGASTMMALILAGQIGMSLIIDHFGIVGFAQKAITWQRLLGAVLVASGVLLIRRY